MNESEAQALVDRLAAALPDSPPAVADVAAAGRRARRRRDLGRVGATAAAVILVIAGGLAATYLAGGDTRGEGLVEQPAGPTTLYLDGVSVVVPIGWSPLPFDCLSDVEADQEDVAYGVLGATSCGDGGEPTSYARLSVADTQQEENIVQHSPDLPEVDGYQVRGDGEVCRESQPPICTRVLAIVKPQVVITVHTSGPDGTLDVQGILDSLHVGEHGEPPHTRLEPAEVPIAQRLADDEIAKNADDDITSAFAWVTPGYVHDSNVGHTCTSGTVLHLVLAGPFDVMVAGAIGAADPPGSSIVVDADPATGQPCVVGVRLDQQQPAPEDTVLDPG